MADNFREIKNKVSYIIKFDDTVKKIELFLSKYNQKLTKEEKETLEEAINIINKKNDNEKAEIKNTGQFNF